MAKAPKNTESETEISILEVAQGVMEFCILGDTPLVFNRMSEKAKRELLLPKGRKTAADKAGSLKHDPIEEYRASVYRHEKDVAPTRLQFPSNAFKGAMGTAALDLPGTKKAVVGRLVMVEDWNIPI